MLQEFKAKGTSAESLTCKINTCTMISSRTYVERVNNTYRHDTHLLLSVFDFFELLINTNDIKWD